jgi:glycosyltransferase involved in cell wall biosynthesis
LTYGDESDRNWEDELNGIELLPVYERIKRPKKKLLRFLQSFLIPFYFKNELRQTNILKTNQVSGSWVAVISKWLFNKQLLTRCGYEAYKNSLHSDNSNLLHYLLRVSSLMAYRSADHILLNTNEIASFVKNTFEVKTSKITVAPNWIDTNRFFPSPKISYNSKILFVGRFSKEKNITMLLYALKGTGIGLDLVGNGEIQPDLQHLALKLGVETNFLGRFPNDQMPEIYNRYRIYVLCSHYEGNPKTLLEAMACGCAVMGSNVPGIRDVIVHNQSGLLVPPNALALQKAIKLLTANAILCKSLGVSARKQIIKNNSLDNYLNKEVQIYRNMVKSSGFLSI